MTWNGLTEQKNELNRFNNELVSSTIIKYAEYANFWQIVFLHVHKRYCKSKVYMKHFPNSNLKIILEFFKVAYSKRVAFKERSDCI